MSPLERKKKRKREKEGGKERRGKEKRKGIQIGKGSETLHADGMIIYVRNLMECSKKLVELIRMFSKIADDRSK